jgi:hypothetical protein
MKIFDRIHSKYLMITNRCHKLTSDVHKQNMISGDNGVTQNNYAISSGWVSDLPGGGGSGGSIWLHCYRITGYGIILQN